MELTEQGQGWGRRCDILEMLHAVDPVRRWRYWSTVERMEQLEWSHSFNV
jgi:hypothetical protein